MALTNPRVRQLLQKRSLYSKVIDVTYIAVCTPKSRLSCSPKADLSSFRRPKPCIHTVNFHRKCTSIFSERKAFDARRARRVTLRLATSLLAQYGSFSEKLTFIQNSLLLLYIDKKMKNWKTVSLFFWFIFWQSLFFLQPGGKYRSYIWKSCSCWCGSFFSLMPGSWFYFCILEDLKFYIYRSLI